MCCVVDDVRSQCDCRLARVKDGILSLARKVIECSLYFSKPCPHREHGSLRDFDQTYTLFRRAKFFEGLDSAQIRKLVQIAAYQTYPEDHAVIRQGEIGQNLYLVVSGKLVATVQEGDDIQEHRRYSTGSLFGERALISNQPRAATVSAQSAVELLSVSRADFERYLGPMSQLQEEQYMLDPRKCLAEFFLPGDDRGPKGSLDLACLDHRGNDTTSWFAVYRPTSRTAIALMLQREAVGKGLNVKGKSAKRGKLSGLVPFLQISEARHKAEIEQSPPGARVQLYFVTAETREIAQCHLHHLMKLRSSQLLVEDHSIYALDDYSPQAWGLDIPEPLLQEAYITGDSVGITPPAEWITGRASEPAFMNMNLHAVRGDSKPKVVIFQYDAANPMNPFGLVVAYAETQVKPVVSDFDTFLVGSRNMPYKALPPEQLELAEWSLKRTEELLEAPCETKTWTSRWLEVLTSAAEQGFYPPMPPFGFGDPTSCQIIQDVITATLSCGAVRHGAECFNFWFPQELDQEYLVVWERCDAKLWEYMTEPDLRAFLLQRASEGYSFPLNPIWPVRDEGWYGVLQALLNQAEQNAGCRDECTIHAWFPPENCILESIERIHHRFADRFTTSRKISRIHTYADVSSCERAELGMHQVDQIRYRLVKEIESGRSHFVLDSDGSLLRTISVIVLDLTQSIKRYDLSEDVNGEEGSLVVLTQVWDSGVDKVVRYRLPGHKLKTGESPRSCLDRLLIDKLALTPGAIEISKEEKKTLVKKSQTFQCKTQYDRYIFHASLKCDSACGMSRVRVSNDDTLVYEVVKDSGCELAPLPCGANGCPLEHHVQSLLDDDSCVDDETGCDLFAVPHAEEIGRVAVFSWLEPQKLKELSDGFDASVKLGGIRRGSRRKSETDVELFRRSTIVDEDQDPQVADLRFSHALTQISHLRRRSTRQYTAPNLVRPSPVSSMDVQEFRSNRPSLH